MSKSRCTKNIAIKCPICGNEFYIRHGKKNWLNKVFCRGKYYFMCSNKCKEQFLENKELTHRKYGKYNT